MRLPILALLDKRLFEEGRDDGGEGEVRHQKSTPFWGDSADAYAQSHWCGMGAKKSMRYITCFFFEERLLTAMGIYIPWFSQQ